MFASSRLTILDKDIIRHLTQNGSLRDAVGIEMVAKFSQIVLGDSKIGAVVRHYGFSAEDICVAFVEMVECLMEPRVPISNPTIRSGLPMLAATLPFIEFHRMENFMATVNQIAGSDASFEKRREIILSLAQRMAKEIFVAHNASRGECPFNVNLGGSGIPRVQGGCASVVLVLVISAGLFYTWLL
jgi:hypothetical protein